MVISGGHSSLLDRCKMAEAPPAALAKLAVLATAAVDPRLPAPRVARRLAGDAGAAAGQGLARQPHRSEEHTSELQSLMRNSYAVFCLKKTPQPSINQLNTPPKVDRNTSSKHTTHYTQPRNSSTLCSNSSM